MNTRATVETNYWLLIIWVKKAIRSVFVFVQAASIPCFLLTEIRKLFEKRPVSIIRIIYKCKC